MFTFMVFERKKTDKEAKYLIHQVNEFCSQVENFVKSINNYCKYFFISFLKFSIVTSYFVFKLPSLLFS